MKKIITLELDEEDIEFIKNLSIEVCGINNSAGLDRTLRTTIKEYINKAYKLGKKQSQYE